MIPNKSLSTTGLLLLAALPLQAQTGGVASKDKNGGRNFAAERAQVDKSWKILGLKWERYIKSQAAGLKTVKPAPRAPVGMDLLQLQKMELDAKTPAAERESLARSTVNGFSEPGELRSKDGTLTAVLVATYARNFIGTDPVYLRSYNGQLTGPTLRVRPGDTLHITLRNDLPTEPWKKDSMNTLHDFNTTNLHTHGLHVSPNGVSDNVLIDVGPGATQEYEIVIPKDHTCGTYWYHAHRHGSTAANVASGMSGALIIEGGIDDIPAIKAAKERVLVLNQIPYLYKQTLDDGSGGKITFNFPEGIIEESIAGYIFGPGDWEPLQHHTTVNGVQLPVIRMSPGQVERWRIVDSGQREMINLQITGTLPGTPDIPFNEIAVDGLALGKTVTKGVVQLLPGYRSDVLIQAPEKPGEYLLIDQATASGIDGQGEPLKYIARILIEGDPVKMNLPADKEMAPFRLPTLQNAKIDLPQTAVYGILPKPGGGGVVFTIDGKSFDMDQAKELLLGNTDEWTVSVRNSGGINTGHPFHIHVNPFEVFSIMGPQDPNNPGSPQVEQLTGGPVWHDTLWVPNNGTVKFRTRYTDFIGTFVQHCHILDHEDQGMMELIDIRDPGAPIASTTTPANKAPATGSGAPAFRQPDAQGKHYALSDYAGQRLVVFLFKGHGCLHCAQQVKEYTALHGKFKAKGIQVIGITSDNAATLKGALAEAPCPFPILADPDGRAFAAYGCTRASGLIHGTFLIDEKGMIEWSTTGASPYLAVSQLLERTPATTAAASEAPAGTLVADSQAAPDKP